MQLAHFRTITYFNMETRVLSLENTRTFLGQKYPNEMTFQAMDKKIKTCKEINEKSAYKAVG